MTPAWTVAPADPESAGLAAACGLSPLVAALLRRRGIDTPDAVRRFLEPRLDDLDDPESLPGMGAAVDRVAEALRRGETVAVHGDYDVDGLTSAAVVLRGLRAAGAARLCWHVPHRLRDGYGLGAAAVSRLAGEGARLLIATDCGITAVENIAGARNLGLDVVVLDHHTPGPERPAALVVEPAVPRPGAMPFSAAGLAFMFVLALRRRLGLLPAVLPGLASLAALGTIADVVPLLEDNRRLAACGLAEMRAGPLPGLKALIDIAGLSGPVGAWHVSWQLAPRLNAPGRLGDPRPALAALTSDDAEECRALARELDAANRERQAILEAALAAAAVQADAAPDAAALVVAAEGWHPGIVGLIAGRLTERYGRPAAAIGLAGGVGRGSARSISGFNLVEGLRACAAHLLGYGGHSMAAGFTIAGEAVDAFRAAFHAAASPALAGRPAPAFAVDAEVALADLRPSLVAELWRLAPFGPGNPEPVLAIRGAHAVRRRVVGDGRHLRFEVDDGTAAMDAIGFSLAAAGELLTFTEAPVDLAAVPELDPADPGRTELRVVALDVPGVDPERLLADTGALVDRLFRRAADYLGTGGTGRAAAVEDAGQFYTKVAGVSFEDRQAVAAALRPGDRLRLVREPHNPHDPHAVRVVAEDGRPVGYLRAALAGRLAPSMDAGVPYEARVAGTTGGGERTTGVNILIERAERTPLDASRAAAAAVPGAPAPAATGPRAPSAAARHLREQYTLSPLHDEIAAAIARGAVTAAALPPGRGPAAVLAHAAAITAEGGRALFVAVPLRRLAVHRAEQLRARLRPLGLRVEVVHGGQDVGERERVDAALRDGRVDAVVATWEAAASGWAARHPGRFAAVFCERLSPADADRLATIVEGPAHWINAEPPEGVGRTVFEDRAERTALRLVDRRGADAVDAVARVTEEALRRDEKMVVYTAGREACVELAARLRGQAGAEARVAYLHGGLPARIRQIVLQAFREGRIAVLVATAALDEEALPEDLRHVVLASLPADAEQFAAAAGPAGFADRPVVVTLAFGPQDAAARRAMLDARCPDRPVLAAVYRALWQWRGGAAFRWPDEDTWAVAAAARPGVTRETVAAALAMFEEAGVAVREGSGGAMEVQLCAGRRSDLAASVRYREGAREREAFERAAAWLRDARAVELLWALAARRGPAPGAAAASAAAGAERPR
jgi:single-stranded-DNA-specific exonuclease